MFNAPVYTGRLNPYFIENESEEITLETAIYNENLIPKSDRQERTGLILQANADIFKVENEDNLKAYNYLTIDRGLTTETIHKYRLGVIAEHKGETYYKDNYGNFQMDPNGKTTIKIVIPYPNTSYYITRTIDQKAFYKLPNVEEPIFNIDSLEQDKPVFICESQLDAITVLQEGYQALALNGSNNVDKLFKCIDHMGGIKAPVVTFLDNDTSGQDATERLIKGLKSRYIAYLRIDTNIMTDKGVKDANEWLIKDVESLRNTLEEYDDRARSLEYEDTLNTKMNDFIAFSKERTERNRISTGFNNLDNQLNGGLYSGLYVIGAISSLGKTTFVLQMADFIAKQGEPVFIFSLEMGAYELIARSLSRLTFDEGIAERKSANEVMKQTDSIAVRNAIAKYNAYNRNVRVYENVTKVVDMRKIIENHINKYGKKPVVIVDYLQLMEPYNERFTDKQNTDRNVKELKTISRDFNIPVLVVSSFNRTSYNKDASMSAFKESGIIEYTSDVLIALQPQGIRTAKEGQTDQMINDHKQKDVREIEGVILKNRYGSGYGTMYYTYYAKYNYFMEDLKPSPTATIEKQKELANTKRK